MLNTPSQNFAVATLAGSGISSDLMTELAGAAKDAAAKERPAVGRVSLKSGQMSYAGALVPGNRLDVIILSAGRRNVWYAGSYDPDNIVNPSCFALSENDEGICAHPNVPDADVPGASDDALGASRKTPRSCKGCAKSAWGSAVRDGRPSKGKACKETRRLVLLPADCLTGDTPEQVEANIKAAEMAVLDLPVTSVANYSGLVSTLAATLGLPVWAVVTNIAVAPDPRKQFVVNFTPTAPAGDDRVVRALMQRRAEATRIAVQPYEGVGGEQAGNPQAASTVKTNKFTAARKA